MYFRSSLFQSGVFFAEYYFIVNVINVKCILCQVMLSAFI